jgi:hypothetical protein
MGNQQWASVMNSRHEPYDKKQIPRSIDRLARGRELWISFILVAIFATTFIVGKLLWSDQLYTAEKGLGYYFGLSGGIFMLFAYAYALVKYVPVLRRGSVIMFSLRTHIILAVVGCYLILLHSTFQIGSLNSGVAYISMFLVFISGVIGRYLYTRTHYGIGQAKATLVEMESQLVLFRDNDELRILLEKIQADYLRQRYSFISAVFRLAAYPAVKRHLKKALRRSGITSRNLIKAYIINVKKIALFSVYERLFHAWRHAHVPLLMLLLLSGVIHVIAVHIY